MKENTESSSILDLSITSSQYLLANQVTLLLLHGTGGNEEDLIPLGRELYPRAAILGPRGKVLESGSRLAEGVFDLETEFRTHELADFVKKASEVYKFNLGYIISVGY
jgi:phospholipase/carboxylesterase